MRCYAAALVVSEGDPGHEMDGSGEWLPVAPVAVKAQFWMARGSPADFVVRGAAQGCARARAVCVGR